MKLYVQDKEISILQVGDETYVCLTDIVRGEDGADHIKNWMRNRNTVEFLGLWETINNPETFKGVEFDTFRKEAGLNSFTLTPKKWIEATNAIGIVSKAGKGGGTYAHKDIALEFCTWLSPLFKLLVLKEFQRLKQAEEQNGKWDARRLMSKANYTIQTDAIKQVLVPISSLPIDKQGIIYANEAELLNFVLYGVTSKEWKAQNPTLALDGKNLRDYSDTHQLIVLSNLESMNAELIRQKVSQKDRLDYLRTMAISQLNSLSNSRAFEDKKIDSPHKENPKALNTNPSTKKK